MIHISFHKFTFVLFLLDNNFVLHIWRTFYSKFFNIVLFWPYGNHGINISTSAFTLALALQKIFKRLVEFLEAPIHSCFKNRCFENFLKPPSETSVVKSFLEHLQAFLRVFVKTIHSSYSLENLLTHASIKKGLYKGRVLNVPQCSRNWKSCSFAIAHKKIHKKLSQGMGEI